MDAKANSLWVLYRILAEEDEIPAASDDRILQGIHHMLQDISPSSESSILPHTNNTLEPEKKNI